MRSSLARLLLAAGLLSLTTACDTAFTFAGVTVWTFFPLDGDRTWEYASFDDASNRLVIEKGDVTPVDKTDVVTLEHYAALADGSPGDLLAEVRWSSDVNDGVLLHGYTDVAGGGAQVDFDPPVQILLKQEENGQVVETKSGGNTWTSTFVELVGCPTVFDPNWEDEDCVHLKLDDNDSNEATNSLVTGEYWMIPRYGTAWFEVGYYNTRFNLTFADWSEE